MLPDGTVRKRITGWRLDNIFATNSQETFSIGRYKQLQEVKQSRPYWMYVAVMDSATRPDHAAMNGKIWHADHPVWDTWAPPNGFR
jgi:SPP1 gp7 family putative phage head morphogenesis protein